VSSLSNERVVELVSRYFVPVWFSRDDYQVGPRDQGERQALQKIDRERKQRGMEGGSVSINVLNPDGTLLASLELKKASKAENLAAFLEELVEKGKLQPRKPEAVRASTPRSAAHKPATAGGLVLHVLTRYVGKRANFGLSHDWVELTAEEWKALVPAGEARAGKSWEVPAKVADKVFLYFYPPAPNWKVQDSSVLERSLTATVVSASDKEVRVALSARVVVSHPFGGKGTDGKMTAKLTGVLSYDPARRAVTSFLMASDEAKYVWMYAGNPQPETIEIAVESVP